MKCAICGNDFWNEGTKLATCQYCGYVRAADRFFNEDLDEVYSVEYYKSGDYLDYELEETALKKNFANRLEIVRHYVPQGDLLEIGSAYGYFLDLAKSRYKVTGVERNKAVAKRVTKRLGTKILHGDFIHINFGRQKFDAIVSLDTIEHLPNPEEFIKKCASLLKKDGYLFIETGDIGAVLSRMQGENWRLVKPPEHLSYLSLKTLSLLLNQHDFRVIESKRVWFWRSLGQTIFRLIPNITNVFPKRLKTALNIIYPLNTGDLIFVVAKKTAEKH